MCLLSPLFLFLSCLSPLSLPASHCSCEGPAFSSYVQPAWYSSLEQPLTLRALLRATLSPSAAPRQRILYLPWINILVACGSGRRGNTGDTSPPGRRLTDIRMPSLSQAAGGASLRAAATSVAAFRDLRPRRHGIRVSLQPAPHPLP